MNKEISYQIKKHLPIKMLEALYNESGWTSYTENLEELNNAVINSLYVVAAFNMEEELVGLVRVVGDGYSIVYIQDLLVMKKYRRKKIATTLVNYVLSKFDNVRQTVLITDKNYEVENFYKSLGFTDVEKFDIAAYAKFKKNT